MELLTAIAERLVSSGSSEAFWASFRELLREKLGARDVAVTFVGSEEGAASEGVARVPLRLGDAIAGELVVSFDRPIDEELLAVLRLCGLLAGHAASVAPVDAGAERVERLERIAFVDALTGIANRRRFDEVLAAEWSRCAREQTALAVLILDVDYFKVFNDTYGHQAGDACLQAIASALRGCVERPSDLLARYGGEEFVAVLPASDERGAIRMGERFRDAVAAQAVAHAGSTLGRVSISVGIASVVPNAASSAEALLRAADGALYRAKLSGRNRVVGAGYESDAPRAKQTASQSPHQLPEPTSPLIGREMELARLSVALLESRLVTVVGFGGFGKTRLAVEAATSAAERFTDGVRFVDLSDLHDEGAMLARIASAFSVQLGVATRLDALLAALRSKRSLLLLDNCEHVHAAIASVAEGIAASCPGIVMLATSREALGVPGEVTLQLTPLSLPPERVTPTAAGVSAFGAVALFVERARAVTSAFMVTDENARTVARVCRVLEGIPLAIELAAARLRLFGIEELAARLVEHFRLLNLSRQGGAGGARQQTIRATIAWSYDLLSKHERALFRRLGIFVGGWSVDAASVVCAFEPLDGWDILDLLIVLEGKSLVSIANRSGEPGYAMLESLGEFAREQLEATGETEVAAGRHAQYFRDYVESADGTYWEQERTAFNDPVIEFDNLRAALKWMLEDGNDVAGGAATAAATMRFWFFARDEGRRWAQLAGERLPPGSDPAIEARLALGLVQVEALPAPLMRAAAERSVAYYRDHGRDPLRLAESLYQTAMTIGLYFPEDRAIAEQLAIEGLALARTLPSRRLLPFALRARAQTMDPADIAGRRSLLAEGLELSQKHSESPRLLAMFLMSLSELDFESGQHASAAEYGRLAVAEAMRADTTRLIAMTKTNLAHYSVMLNDRETGRREAIDAIRQADETQDQYSMTLALHALACSMAGTDDSAEAARLLGFCDTRFGAMHPPRQEGGCEETVYAHAHRILIAELGDELLDREMRAGATMSIDDVLRVALG